MSKNKTKQNRECFGLLRKSSQFGLKGIQNESTYCPLNLTETLCLGNSGS